MEQKIVPCLWFDTEAEEAAAFYTSVFPQGKVLETSHYTASSPKREGQVLTVAFELAGQQFMMLNGGPDFKHSHAFSLMVMCDTQEEIDRYWEKLLEGGGKPVECSWLVDRYGVSWQIAYSRMQQMITDPDRQRADRVMAAMMKMVKLDIATLEEAYAG